ncbi:SagB/ThcOx family dehydrogenase [Mycobacterium sp. MS3]|uniref:SagB/ThcOx family dehydrogenase n=1 Tax=Mycobacterium sp. MS3 TaxID=3391378 RepID=UPI003988ED53
MNPPPSAPASNAAEPRSGSEPVRYRRAPHLALSWQGSATQCIHAPSGRLFHVDDDIITVLSAATEPCILDDLRMRSGVDHAVVLAAVAAGLLVAEEADRLTDWNTYELAVQRLFGRGRARFGLNDVRPRPARLSPPPGTPIALDDIAAPPPKASFSEVLSARRSVRRFADSPLALSQLSRLLLDVLAVQHEDSTTGTWKRPTPSGGARHPLELYVAALNVESLQRRCHYFDPVTRSLVPMGGTEELTIEVEDISMNAMGLVDDGAGRPAPPAAVLMITALYERTMHCYQDFALTLIHKDAGCLLQTLYLQATAQALAGCAIGAGPELHIAAGLGLDPNAQGYVGGFALGARVTDVAGAR